MSVEKIQLITAYMWSAVPGGLGGWGVWIGVFNSNLSALVFGVVMMWVGWMMFSAIAPKRMTRWPK